MSENAKKTDFVKYLGYITLGVLFLMSFNLGGSSFAYIFQGIGFVLALGAYALIEKKESKEDKLQLLYYAIPLIVFAIFSSMSNFWINGFSSVLSALINLIGILAFFYLGYKAQSIGVMSLKNVIAAIAGGLSLIVLLGMISTLVQYGFFHVARYAGMERIYDGLAIEISEEYSTLIGFKLTSVSVEFGLQSAFILACLLPVSLFMDYKTDKIGSIVLTVSGGIGLLAILLAFPMKILLLLAFIYLIAIILRFVKFPKAAPKWEKITGIVLIAIVSLFLIVLLINAIFNPSLFAKGILRKLFDNGKFMHLGNMVINAAFHNQSGSFSLLGLFGLKEGSWAFWNSTAGTVVYSSTTQLFSENHVFEFTAFYEGGLFAFLALFAVMGFGVVGFRKWLHIEEKINPYKVAIVLMLIAFVGYNTFFQDVAPYTILGKDSYYISPFFENNGFMIVAFLLGLAYTPIFKKEKMEDKYAL